MHLGRLARGPLSASWWRPAHLHAWRWRLLTLWVIGFSLTTAYVLRQQGDLVQQNRNRITAQAALVKQQGVLVTQQGAIVKQQGTLVQRLRRLVREGKAAHDGLCTIRAKDVAEVEASLEYLDDVVHGRRVPIQGITVDDIKRGIKRTQDEVASLRRLNCKPGDLTPPPPRQAPAGQTTTPKPPKPPKPPAPTPTGTTTTTGGKK